MYKRQRKENESDTTTILGDSKLDFNSLINSNYKQINIKHYLDIALEFRLEKNNIGAIYIYKRIIYIFPTKIDAYLNLGYLYLSLGETIEQRE